ncbi:hypothetical protein O6H91_07G004700 [Diphasiastrum complanatum]|uniref:Uncharacterized protein n=1 Tax=Diphasiastrum complanatum TaxID=34168 RepID=A0ACC2D1W4_DIPCM|nr:hypothetical protein O6H91_07G004700 [Diphasiastrum complanatum]
MVNEISTHGGRNPPLAGSETELIRIEAAQLYLIDEEDSVLLLQSGVFALILTKQGHSSLAVIDALIGDVHWPVAKDSPVCKIREEGYTFSIPGVLYALIFTEKTSLEDKKELESLLLEYSLFEVRPDLAIAGFDDACMRHSPESHVNAGDDGTAYDGVELSSSKVGHSVSRGSAVVADSITRRSQLASSSIQKGTSDSKSRTFGAEGTGKVEISRRMKALVQRARRMSAVTKLIAKSLMRGAISASNHVQSTLSSRVSSSAPGKAIRERGMEGVALASVDACAKVVDAVESAGASSISAASSTSGSDLVQHRYGDGAGAGEVAPEGFRAMGNAVNSLWTLNKLGLEMLVKAIATSPVIKVARRNAAVSSNSVNAVAVLHGDGDLSPETSNLSRQAAQLLAQAFESRNSVIMKGEKE